MSLQRQALLSLWVPLGSSLSFASPLSAHLAGPQLEDLCFTVNFFQNIEKRLSLSLSHYLDGKSMSSGSYLKFQSNGTTESCSFIGEVKIVWYSKRVFKAYITEGKHILCPCISSTLWQSLFPPLVASESLCVSELASPHCTNLHPFNSSNSSSTIVGSIHCGPFLGRQGLLFFFLSINSNNIYFKRYFFLFPTNCLFTIFH